MEYQSSKIEIFQLQYGVRVSILLNFTVGHIYNLTIYTNEM